MKERDNQISEDALAVRIKYGNRLVCAKCNKRPEKSGVMRFTQNRDKLGGMRFRCNACPGGYTPWNFLLMAVGQIPALGVEYKSLAGVEKEGKDAPETPLTDENFLWSSMDVSNGSEIAPNVPQNDISESQPISTHEFDSHDVFAQGASCPPMEADVTQEISTQESVGTSMASSISLGNPVAFQGQATPSTQDMFNRKRGNGDIEADVHANCEKEIAALRRQVEELTSMVKQLLTAQAQSIGFPPVIQGPNPKGKVTRPPSDINAVSTPNQAVSTPKKPVSPSKAASKPSFAQVVAAQLEHRQKATEAFLKANQKARTVVRAKPATFNAESETKTRIHYVYGFGFIKVGQLRTHLWSMQFRMSSIINIRYIGRSTVEFIVKDDYSIAFETRIKKLPILTLAQDFDPRVYRGANATGEDQKNASQRFAAGVVATIVKSKNAIVQSFFKSIIAESSAEIQQLAEAELTRHQGMAEVNKSPVVVAVDVDTDMDIINV
jgi:hypothetical protein